MSEVLRHLKVFKGDFVLISSETAWSSFLIDTSLREKKSPYWASCSLFFFLNSLVTLNSLFSSGGISFPGCGVEELVQARRMVLSVCLIEISHMFWRIVIYILAVITCESLIAVFYTLPVECQRFLSLTIRGYISFLSFFQPTHRWMNLRTKWVVQCLLLIWEH